MSWEVFYHPEVADDPERIGQAAARRVMRAIDSKLAEAPMSFGAPLAGNLADFRKLRVGDFRVVYRVREHRGVVFVLAVGHRRDKKVYRTALKRKQIAQASSPLPSMDRSP
jgi:mRNA interferase RelE/StbE